jgi:hypothetical protein
MAFWWTRGIYGQRGEDYVGFWVGGWDLYLDLGFGWDLDLGSGSGLDLDLGSGSGLGWELRSKK